jgi:hypothetical protein
VELRRMGNRERCHHHRQAKGNDGDPPRHHYPYGGSFAAPLTRPQATPWPRDPATPSGTL